MAEKEDKRKVFEYQGSVLDGFGREVIRNWKAQTLATSEQQAINNLKFQAKQKLRLSPRASVTLTKKPKAIERPL